MNKKNSPKRRRMTDPQFSQPAAFIRATGYTPEGNHLDRQDDSVEVCSAPCDDRISKSKH